MASETPMVKLFAISVALLLFQVNGVDRIFYGITALEAFRNKGVILVIEYYSETDEVLDV